MKLLMGGLIARQCNDVSGTDLVQRARRPTGV